MSITRLRSLRHRVAGMMALLWLCGAVAAAQAPAPASPPPVAQAGTDKGFIWKVERGGRAGWLVGSLHLATPDFYPLPASMENAFARADTLVEEIDQREAASPEFVALVLSKAMYPSGTTLASQISRDTYTRVDEWLTKAGLGIGAFQQMKPWMASITIQTMALQRLGFDPAHGIDRYFADAAIRTKKRFIALETAAEQIGYLDGLSPRTQDLMLRESVESVETEAAEIQTLATAWRRGDAGTIERIALEGFDDAREVYQSLLVDRNRRWMPAIESCVQSHSCFVVVGAAHLVGPEGLIALLRGRGYSVEQM